MHRVVLKVSKKPRQRTPRAVVSLRERAMAELGFLPSKRVSSGMRTALRRKMTELKSRAAQEELKARLAKNAAEVRELIIGTRDGKTKAAVENIAQGNLTPFVENRSAELYRLDPFVLHKFMIVTAKNTQFVSPKLASRLRAFSPRDVDLNRELAVTLILAAERIQREGRRVRRKKSI